MFRTVVNVETGEVTQVDLTPEEIAAIPPSAPLPVPNLTFAQLLFGLVTEGFITQQEGNDWLIARILPANVEAAISQLPGPQQLLMRARALQPTEVLFSDPMVQSMGAAQGKTQEQMAQFFRTYSVV